MSEINEEQDLEEVEEFLHGQEQEKP